MQNSNSGQRSTLPVPPPGPKRTPQHPSAGSEGGAGIVTRLRGSGTAPAPIRRGPHPEEPPSPGTGASRRGTRPPRRAAGDRRSLPLPLNLPGDSDAGVPRNPAGKSRSQLRLSPERRDPGSSSHRSTRARRPAPGSRASSGSGTTSQACQARRGPPPPVPPPKGRLR